MTPKEKAKELISTFEIYTRPLFGLDEYDKELRYNKECALIVVNEVEKALTDYGQGSSMELQNMDSEFRYWDRVKEEINKL